MGSSEPARAEVVAEAPIAGDPAAEPDGAAHSRFVQRIRRRYAAELSWLAPGRPRRESIVALVERLRASGRSLVSALRVARQLSIERLAVLDIEAGASLDDVTGAMTELAETTLDLAAGAGFRRSGRALRRAAQRRRRARSTSGSSAWASSAPAS